MGMTEDTKSPAANEEQLLYAKILEVGMFLGLALLLLTFILYVLGVVAPAVPLSEVPNYWVLSVHDYMEAINRDFLHRDHVVTGWGWLWVVGKGDFLNFLGIALLSGVTVVCYVGIIPTLFRKRQIVYLVIASAETIILVLAASGILAVGH